MKKLFHTINNIFFFIFNINLILLIILSEIDREAFKTNRREVSLFRSKQMLLLVIFICEYANRIISSIDCVPIQFV